MVEIIVVVTIIGLLAAMAVAAFTRVQRRARHTRFAVDLRSFANAFEAYALENGGWPAAASNGTVPAGMSGALPRQSWTTRNSLGGVWNWDVGSGGVKAGISTTGVAANDAEMREIDAAIDDGSLSTGRFRKSGGRYLLVLEE